MQSQYRTLHYSASRGKNCRLFSLHVNGDMQQLKLIGLCRPSCGTSIPSLENWHYVSFTASRHNQDLPHLAVGLHYILKKNYKCYEIPPFLLFRSLDESWPAPEAYQLRHHCFSFNINGCQPSTCYLIYLLLVNLHTHTYLHVHVCIYAGIIELLSCAIESA